MKHLERVAIKNFLCYKEEHSFSFTPGVNAIVGPNGKGKSSILAAISWVVFGRPSGDTVVNWDGEKDTYVSLYFEDGLWVQRCRIKDKNFYFWSFKNEPTHELTAIGNSVPEEIEKLLQLQDINFQGQANNLFPMQMTPSELGITINRYCQLGDMHETVKRLSTEITGDQNKYTNNQIRESFLQDQIEDTEWAVLLEGKLLSASSSYSQIAFQSQNCIKVSSLLSQIRETKKKLVVFEKRKTVLQERIEEARERRDKMKGIGDSCKTVNRMLDQIFILSALTQKLKRKLLTKAQIEEAKQHWNKTKQMEYAYETAKKNLKSIQNIFLEKQELEGRIKYLRTIPIEIRKQLPPICPLCGEERRST